MTRPPPDQPPYERRHTSADPSSVVTETQVPNENKALPSQKGPALVLAFAGAGVALLAVILEWMHLDLMALVLAIVAMLMTIVAVVMALNDQRTGAGAPIACAAAAAIVLLVVLLDVMGAPEAVQDVREDIRDDTQQRLDDADNDTVNPPADPADIVEGEAE